MSNPNPRIVQELAEEIDAQEFEGAMICAKERVDMADPVVSSSEEEEDLDPTSAHRRRMKIVKAVEKQLQKK